MPGKLTIRDATADDLPEVSRLLGEAWHATYDAIHGAERVSDITRRWHAPAALARGLDEADVRFRVAEAEDGSLAGTASVSRGRGGAVKLDRLYVRPDRQRAGIGQALLADAIAAFPEATLMRLEVEPGNQGAIAFYEARGFRPAGRAGDCGGSGDGIAALMMERPVKA